MTKIDTSKRGGLSDFATKAGISVGYAHQLMADPGSKNFKEPPIETALLIYRRTGVKLGIIKNADTREANALLRIVEKLGGIPADDEPKAKAA